MKIPIKNKLNDNERFRIKRMKEVIKTTHPHGHKDYLEIIYLEEGAGTHQIDYNRYPVSPFSLYLVMPGQIHHWQLTAIPRGYVTMIHKDFLLNHPLYEILFQTFPLQFPGSFHLDDVHDVFAGIFRYMHEECEKSEPNHTAVIQSYLSLLFNLLKRYTVAGQTSSFPPLLKNFFSALDLEYRTYHETGHYADRLNTTSKTLNAACKKFLGKTAREVIHEKLTAESKKLLLYAHKTLTEIAYELGFSDPSHFNKFFRRQTGVLPGIYRKGIS